MPRPKAPKKKKSAKAKAADFQKRARKNAQELRALRVEADRLRQELESTQRNLAEMAALYGRKTARQYARKLGNGWKEKRRAAVEKDRVRGMTLEGMALKYRVSTQTIGMVIAQHMEEERERQALERLASMGPTIRRG